MKIHEKNLLFLAVSHLCDGITRFQIVYFSFEGLCNVLANPTYVLLDLSLGYTVANLVFKSGLYGDNLSLCQLHMIQCYHVLI